MWSTSNLIIVIVHIDNAVIKEVFLAIKTITLLRSHHTFTHYMYVIQVLVSHFGRSILTRKTIDSVGIMRNHHMSDI